MSNNFRIASGRYLAQLYDARVQVCSMSKKQLETYGERLSKLPELEEQVAELQKDVADLQQHLKFWRERAEDLQRKANARP